MEVDAVEGSPLCLAPSFLTNMVLKTKSTWVDGPQPTGSQFLQEVSPARKPYQTGLSKPTSLRWSCVPWTTFLKEFGSTSIASMVGGWSILHGQASHGLLTTSSLLVLDHCWVLPPATFRDSKGFPWK